MGVAKSRNRKAHLKRAYGITEEQYESMRQYQGGLCAICLIPIVGKMAIDHNHFTGKVRGLLCKKCNSGLGLFNELASSLERAAKYLRRHTETLI